MGASSSKSTLERRNTITRRSQRKGIHDLKGKVEKFIKQLKKFEGISEGDLKYIELKSQLEHFNTELTKKRKGLQPELNTIHNLTFTKIEEAYEALKNKLKENQEKAAKAKEKELEEQKKKGIEEEKELENNNEEPQKVEEKGEKQVKEENDLVQTENKRKTVELKFVKFEPGYDEPKNESTTQAEIHQFDEEPKSLEQKRASILKMGIQVMPSFDKNQITTQTDRISKQYNQHQSLGTSTEDIQKRLKEITQSLQDLELHVSEFVGKKNSTHYNKLREELNKYLIELNIYDSNDEYINDQLKILKNYAGSTLNFLDERATVVESTASEDEDDDIFDSNVSANINQNPYDLESRIKRLSKSTAI